MGLGAVRELVFEREGGRNEHMRMEEQCVLPHCMKDCNESWGLHSWKIGLGGGGGMEERTLER